MLDKHDEGVVTKGVYRACDKPESVDGGSDGLDARELLHPLGGGHGLDELFAVEAALDGGDEDEEAEGEEVFEEGHDAPVWDADPDSARVQHLLGCAAVKELVLDKSPEGLEGGCDGLDDKGKLLVELVAQGCESGVVPDKVWGGEDDVDSGDPLEEGGGRVEEVAVDDGVDDEADELDQVGGGGVDGLGEAEPGEHFAEQNEVGGEVVAGLALGGDKRVERGRVLSSGVVREGGNVCARDGCWGVHELADKGIGLGLWDEEEELVDAGGLFGKEPLGVAGIEFSHQLGEVVELDFGEDGERGL